MALNNVGVISTFLKGGVPKEDQPKIGELRDFIKDIDQDERVAMAESLIDNGNVVIDDAGKAQFVK